MAEKKPYELKSYRALKIEDLYEHASDLKNANEALDALEKLEDSEVDFTPALQEKYRIKMRKKTRRPKVEVSSLTDEQRQLYTAEQLAKGKVTFNTGIRLHSEADIDAKIKEILQNGGKVKENDFFAVKEKYCREFWNTKLPKSGDESKAARDKEAKAKQKVDMREKYRAKATAK